MSDTLELIANLLRKAERTDNQHEKDAFFTRAQTLATRNSIDLAVARAHTAKAEQREQIEERAVRIGYKGTTGLADYVQLFLAIGKANDLRFLIANDSTVVYAHGFPSDIDVTEALYASLVGQMVKASEEYLKTGDHKNDTVWVEGGYKKKYTGEKDYWGDREYTEDYVPGHYKPVHGRVARRSFYAGFASRIQTRLLEAKQTTEQAAILEDETAQQAQQGTSGLVSLALVLVEKQTAVTEWHAAEIKRRGIRGSYKGGRSSGHSGSGRQAGDRAGRSANLGGNTQAIGA